MICSPIKHSRIENNDLLLCSKSNSGLTPPISLETVRTTKKNLHQLICTLTFSSFHFSMGSKIISYIRKHYITLAAIGVIRKTAA